MQELLVSFGNLPQKDLNLLLTMMRGVRPRQGQMPKQIIPPLSEKTRFLWGNISPKFSHKGADMLSGRVRFGTIGPESGFRSGQVVPKSLVQLVWNIGPREALHIATQVLAGVRTGRVCGLVAGGCADWLPAVRDQDCWQVCRPGVVAVVRRTHAGGCAEYACWWANNVQILGPIDLQL